mmetsp:Transcript_29401/g.69117  ORF Transcript_29401/g.69117 Transcript_29401/m.69117 type:complete len:83 (+) Transcript_29401:1246-1494(+)
MSLPRVREDSAEKRTTSGSSGAQSVIEAGARYAKWVWDEDDEDDDDDEAPPLPVESFWWCWLATRSASAKRSIPMTTESVVK